MKIYLIAKATELEMGIEAEKEHLNIYRDIEDLLKKHGLEMPWTEDEFAEKIAKDHLAEMSDYYSKLKKMEAEG